MSPKGSPCRLIAKGMTVEEAAEVAGVSVEVLRSGG
jgi:hypothetical protein